MADTKISDLTALTALVDNDLLVVVDTSASATKKIKKIDLRTTLVSSPWSPVSSTKYTATPASTSRLTMSDTSMMAVGLPLKYTIATVDYWGIVTAVTANTHIDVAGAPLSGDVTALWVGPPHLVVQHDFFISSTYGDGVADLLDADLNRAFRWCQQAACLVSFEVKHKTDDSGAEQPKVNVKVNGSAVSTNDTNKGIQLTTSWQANSAVAINLSNYDIQRGEAVEISCTAAGSNGDAANLSVETVWVLQ